MARLYAWINSDTRKTKLTTRGNKEITVRVNYGTKYQSILAVEMLVEFPEGAKYPTVRMLRKDYVVIEDNVVNEQCRS